MTHSHRHTWVLQLTRGVAASPRHWLAFLAGLAIVFASVSPASVAPGDRFRPSSASAAGAEGDELSTPIDFEMAAASRPDVNAKVLVSRCRFAPFSGDASYYGPISGTTADAIVGDTEFFFADGTHCYNPQNESNIVINPTQPNNVITAANEYRVDGHAVYSSTDGGSSWRNVVLPGWTAATGGKGLFARLSSCGDPVLAFGPDGSAYYAGLVCNAKNAVFFSGVAVAKSLDGGASWGAPRMVSFNDSPVMFHDKEWITVGPDGTVYLTWTRFKVAQNRYVASPIVMSVSRNGGASWSDWMEVSDASHPFNQGSVPAVAPDGTLYVAYEGSTPASGYNADAIIVAKARTTGSSFSFTNTEVARAYDDYNCYPINVAQQRQTLSGEQFRINSFPSFAIDPSTGSMAIVWADNQANAGCGYEKGGSFAGVTSNQVKLITSANGSTWSTPRVITAGPADKVYPAVGANAGRIAVGYYTRAYSPSTDDCKALLRDTVTGAFSVGPGPVCLDFAVRSSTDNFAVETRVTSQSSNPFITFAGAFIGDYNGVAVGSSGNAFAVWADFRGSPGLTTPNMDVNVERGF